MSNSDESQDVDLIVVFYDDRVNSDPFNWPLREHKGRITLRIARDDNLTPQALREKIAEPLCVTPNELGDILVIYPFPKEFGLKNGQLLPEDFKFPVSTLLDLKADSDDDHLTVSFRYKLRESISLQCTLLSKEIQQFWRKLTKKFIKDGEPAVPLLPTYKSAGERPITCADLFPDLRIRSLAKQAASSLARIERPGDEDAANALKSLFSGTGAADRKTDGARKDVSEVPPERELIGAVPSLKRLTGHVSLKLADDSLSSHTVQISGSTILRKLTFAGVPDDAGADDKEAQDKLDRMSATQLSSLYHFFRFFDNLFGRDMLPFIYDECVDRHIGALRDQRVLLGSDSVVKRIRESVLEPFTRTRVSSLQSATERGIRHEHNGTKQVWFGHHPSGLLLHGPPGTGKSFLLNCLLDMERPVHVDDDKNALGLRILFAGSAAALFEGEVGKTQNLLRRLFGDALEHRSQLCVIFFDEFESLAAKRDGAAAEKQAYKADFTNQLLGLLGSGAYSNVLVVSATNYKHKLDEAVLRAGRVEKHVLVGALRANERRTIVETAVKATLQSEAAVNDAIVEHICEHTINYSSAQLHRLLLTFLNQCFLHDVESQLFVEAGAGVETFKEACALLRPLLVEAARQSQNLRFNQLALHLPSIAPEWRRVLVDQVCLQMYKYFEHDVALPLAYDFSAAPHRCWEVRASGRIIVDAATGTFELEGVARPTLVCDRLAALARDKQALMAVVECLAHRWDAERVRLLDAHFHLEHDEKEFRGFLDSVAADIAEVEAPSILVVDFDELVGVQQTGVTYTQGSSQSFTTGDSLSHNVSVTSSNAMQWGQSLSHATSESRTHSVNRSRAEGASWSVSGNDKSGSLPIAFDEHGWLVAPIGRGGKKSTEGWSEGGSTQVTEGAGVSVSVNEQVQQGTNTGVTDTTAKNAGASLAKQSSVQAGMNSSATAQWSVKYPFVCSALQAFLGQFHASDMFRRCVLILVVSTSTGRQLLDAQLRPVYVPRTLDTMYVGKRSNTDDGKEYRQRISRQLSDLPSFAMLTRVFFYEHYTVDWDEAKRVLQQLSRLRSVFVYVSHEKTISPEVLDAIVLSNATHVYLGGQLASVHPTIDLGRWDWFEADSPRGEAEVRLENAPKKGGFVHVKGKPVGERWKHLSSAAYRNATRDNYDQYLVRHLAVDVAQWLLLGGDSVLKGEASNVGRAVRRLSWYAAISLAERLLAAKLKDELQALRPWLAKVFVDDDAVTDETCRAADVTIPTRAARRSWLKSLVLAINEID